MRNLSSCCSVQLKKTHLAGWKLKLLDQFAYQTFTLSKFAQTSAVSAEGKKVLQAFQKRATASWKQGTLLIHKIINCKPRWNLLPCYLKKRLQNVWAYWRFRSLIRLPTKMPCMSAKADEAFIWPCPIKQSYLCADKNYRDCSFKVGAGGRHHPGNGFLILENAEFARYVNKTILFCIGPPIWCHLRRMGSRSPPKNHYAKKPRFLLVPEAIMADRAVSGHY